MTEMLKEIFKKKMSIMLGSLLGIFSLLTLYIVFLVSRMPLDLTLWSLDSIILYLGLSVSLVGIILLTIFKRRIINWANKETFQLQREKKREKGLICENCGYFLKEKHTKCKFCGQERIVNNDHY